MDGVVQRTQEMSYLLKLVRCVAHLTELVHCVPYFKVLLADAPLESLGFSLMYEDVSIPRYGCK